MLFEMTDVEVKRAKEFREYIKTEYGERHFKNVAFSYIFTPNGISNSVAIRENESGEERDISDMDSW